MIFNSLVFVAFFFVVLAVHYSPLPMAIRKGSLLTANFLFFASYHPPYVLLLAASTVIDWLLAKRIEEAEGPRRKFWLFGSILLNVGVLCFFKYADFALENFRLLLHSFGVLYQPPKLGLILPVGISFYTFQALSYTIDIYYKRIKPEPSLANFAMFVSFFPHLVAGPILRARDILPQCRQFHKATWPEFAWGLNLFVWGLFQKVILADQIFAPVADKLFAPNIVLTMLEAWAAALAFTGQIFFDFAGYSTCAIGAALCLGFHIPDNFRFPYGSLGFSDFWRRWHISLSSWLRDYLYIPLGGNRSGKIRTRINLAITMLLGGLWHGAAWHFIAWGAYHGALLIAERQLASVIATCKRLGPVSTLLGWLVTMYGVVISWVVFRATSLGQAWRIVVAMHVHPVKLLVPNIEFSQTIFTIGSVVILMAWHLTFRNTTAEILFQKSSAWVTGIALGLLVSTITLFVGKPAGFLYFQF
jgi:alginate O-acetyltransferase complex protein AlgI